MCHSVKQASHNGTLTCESTGFGLCQMQQTRSYCRKAKCLNRRRGFMASVKGVTHLSRRDKRRLYQRLQFWLWRRRTETCFWLFRRRRRRSGAPAGSGSHLKRKAQQRKVLTRHGKQEESSRVRTAAAASPPRPDAGGSGEAPGRPNGLPEGSRSDGLAAARSDSSESKASAGTLSQTPPTAEPPSQSAEPSVQPVGATRTLKRSRTVQAVLGADGAASAGREQCRKQRAQRPQMDASLQQRRPSLPQTASEETECSVNNANADSLTREIQDFLEGFYRTYGSFVPLHRTDVLRHLERKFNSDFNDRKNEISSEVDKNCAAVAKTPVPSFQVVYKKHVLTLEDLLTLADEQWLNDQVMNMYGELIMESSHHKVHFLNSFFHRQLMTKGYDGVRRWTKQVDLFSKSLLLVPIHLEVHWCLVTADISTKKICLYDSQGHSLQKVARNILKYLISEAKEKKHAAFQEGWTVSIEEKIPQQTNENDCGVFVLEYSRCLALSRPFQFSQQDIPKIRRRIYKELCDWKLHEQD